MNLFDRLRAEKSALATRVVADMYEDPFWNERFAARGRKFSDEDLAYHVDYLIQALVGDDTAIMANYATWLQSILTTRGMCTLHLSDSFGRLAIAVRDPAATKMLTAARAALFYPDGAARTVQERIRDAMVDVAPDRVEDTAYHLSYLADALALGQPRVFIDHITWLAGFIRKQGRDAHGLIATLEAVVRTIEGEQARSIVATALQALAPT